MRFRVPFAEKKYTVEWPPLLGPPERRRGSARHAVETEVPHLAPTTQSCPPTMFYLNPPHLAPPTSTCRAGLENSCNTPSCQADFLPGRLSVMPDFGNVHGAASHGSGGGADYAGRHAASSGTRQGLTLPEPSHPCHAAFLSCRLSATPPFRESEQEQPHASTARGTNGAFDSRQIAAPPRRVPTQEAEPPDLSHTYTGRDRAGSTCRADPRPLELARSDRAGLRIELARRAELTRGRSSWIKKSS